MLLSLHSWRPVLNCAGLAAGFFLMSMVAYGQVTGGVSPLSSAEIQNSLDRPLTLLVSVRETSGIPLSVPAMVKVSPLVGGQNLVSAVRENSTATFANIRNGEYEVEAEAPGYQKANERISVVGSTAYTAYIYLTPMGAVVDKNKPASGMVMTPDLQREVDRSFIALNQKKYDEARKHLEKAHKMAPANPDILYLIGLIDYTEKNIPAARTKFENVLATYPGHQRSLIMLGQIELDTNQNKEASLTLQKAVDTGTVNWQAHYLLAIAYARTGELAKSGIECQRTSELNKDKKPAMDLLQAKLYLMEGKNLDARGAFEAFLRNYPQSSGAAEAQTYLAKIEEAEKAATIKSASEAASGPPTARPAPTVEADPVLRDTSDFSRPWAPPEVDAAVPPVAPGVGCSVNEVLERTQKRILSQLSDLEKFGATEHIEHQFVDNYGVPETAVSQNFEYLIYVHHSEQLPYYFDEMRDGAESLYAFPTSLATRGLVSLGFMVVHPVFSQDFQFTCEGLGTWEGQPAWQIHFAQRGDTPSRIRSWTYKKAIYAIPLKGRIWIAANSYNLLHLETGLRDPVNDLRLYREQLIVDYGPVRFKSGDISLWLPSQADMYFDMQGRRYHHKHTLTNYVLFDVDTKNKIATPPAPFEQEDN